MKKYIFAAMLIGACVVSGTTDAQSTVVNSGELKEALDSTPDNAAFDSPLQCGGIVGEAVDLGLSVKWSSVNVGASAPEDYGNYYAWGETTTKTDYSWATYKHLKVDITNRYFINNQALDAYKALIGDGKTTLE